MIRSRNLILLVAITLILIIGCGPSEKEKFDKMKNEIISNIKSSYDTNSNVRELQNKIWIVYPEKTFSIKNFAFSINMKALEKPDFYTEESIFGRKFIDPKDKNAVNALEDAMAYKNVSTGILIFPVINSNMTSNDFLNVTVFDAKNKNEIHEMSKSTTGVIGTAGTIIAGLLGHAGEAVDIGDASRMEHERNQNILPDEKSGIIIGLNLEKLTSALNDFVDKQLQSSR